MSANTHTMWIDHDPHFEEHLGVGDTRFLINVYNSNREWDRYDLRDHPARTNVSNQPRAVGWCGTYNDTETHGCGVWRVTKVAKNGNLKIIKVTDKAELEEFLEEYGYPDLLSECLDS